MKRFTCLILALLLALSATACSARKPAAKVPVDYYYPYPMDEIAYNGQPTIMDSEQRESLGHEGDWVYLLNEYFKGPVSDELVSPFPARLTVVSLEIIGDMVSLELSNPLGQLTGIDLTVACSCISQTCLGMIPEINKVQISAADTLLEGSKWVIMTRDSMMLLDDSAVPTETADATE